MQPVSLCNNNEANKYILHTLGRTQEQYGLRNVVNNSLKKTNILFYESQVLRKLCPVKQWWNQQVYTGISSFQVTSHRLLPLRYGSACLSKSLRSRCFTQLLRKMSCDQAQCSVKLSPAARCQRLSRHIGLLFGVICSAHTMKRTAVTLL